MRKSGRKKSSRRVSFSGELPRSPSRFFSESRSPSPNAEALRSLQAAVRRLTEDELAAIKQKRIKAHDARRALEAQNDQTLTALRDKLDNDALESIRRRMNAAKSGTSPASLRSRIQKVRTRHSKARSSRAR